MAKLARTPYLTTRGPDVQQPGRPARDRGAGSQPRLSATINYPWQGNNYFQNVGGAEYYIDTPPWAGGTPLTMNPADGKLDSPTEAVQATMDTQA